MRDAGVGAGSGFRPSVPRQHERRNAAQVAAPQAVGEAHRDRLSARQRGTSHCGPVPFGAARGYVPGDAVRSRRRRPGHLGASVS